MNKNLKPSILIYSPSVAGGIAEYTYYQASALAKAGANVVCLIAPSFLDGRDVEFECITCLADPTVKNGTRLARRLRMVWCIFVNQCILTYQIFKRRPDLVLLDSYVEYCSPLWVWPHWLLAWVLGIHYAANLHDPVRSYAIGPVWWHRLSVRLAYLPLNFVLVHDKLPESSPVPARVGVVHVPHGLFEIRQSPAGRDAARLEWGVKAGQHVFLAFGFVRDGKNLDLAVRALVEVKEAFLVIAGSVASANDKPFNYYRTLAEKLDVLDRCHFTEGFVTDEELGKYFLGTDFVLLTYASSFHSQSGVLNIATRARKPVLASAAASPLIETVRKFQLGVDVEPDSLTAVTIGMKQLLDTPPAPRWNDYETSASWDANAQGVLKAASFLTKNKT